MSGMIPHPKRLLHHLSHALRAPDRPSKTEGLGSLCQQGRQRRSWLWTHVWVSPWRGLMPQGFSSLHRGFLEPLAHCPLGHSERLRDLFLFPSLFMPFPGAYPSSFAPLVWRCRFLAPPSLSRPF
jgi:hypothetical protein